MKSNLQEVNNMAQRIQQGSVLGFVLVGALLTALVVGGIFVVRNQLANKSNDTTSGQVATDQPDTNKPDATKDNSDDLKKALEQQSAAEKKAQEQKAASEAQQNSAAAANSNTTATNSLPTTGPAGTAMTLMGAALLAGASVAYARSRSLV
jgi:predicted lipid-binding transport protein (Tim44 family)